MRIPSLRTLLLLAAGASFLAGAAFTALLLRFVWRERTGKVPPLTPRHQRTRIEPLP